MVTGVPNFAVCIGYTNASWTLRADLTHRLVVKVLRWMDRRGEAAVVPGAGRASRRRPLLDLASGYVQRSVGAFPRQGDRRPWQVRQNYVLDAVTTLRADLDATLVPVRAAVRPRETGRAAVRPASVDGPARPLDVRRRGRTRSTAGSPTCWPRAGERADGSRASRSRRGSGRSCAATRRAAGTVWFKECNPGQAFEGPLLRELAAPGARPVPRPAGAGPRARAGAAARRRHASAAGATDGAGARRRTCATCSSRHAAVQQRLAGPRGPAAGRRAALARPGRAAGLGRSGSPTSWPRCRPPTCSTWAATDARRVRAGLPRVRDWCARLADGPVPGTFQHDDLNPWNVAAGPAGAGVVRRGRRVLVAPVRGPAGPAGHGDAAPGRGARRSTTRWSSGWSSAYLGAWTGGRRDRSTDLRPLVAPALLLAQAHRGESWRRLLAHVPADRLGVDPPLLRAYLLRVATTPV